MNALASHLDEGRAENRRLQERMMTLAETERARIASDLHDDMGPQLFALRAAVGQAQSVEKGSISPKTMRSAQTIAGHWRMLSLPSPAMRRRSRNPPAARSRICVP
ncbi:histidine kinase [Paracoccus cavernae]|uniref:histidine kinase n=1 Tax=Paracoccus cavernae TaxID=1571207 RepID=UPI00362C193E